MIIFDLFKKLLELEQSEKITRSMFKKETFDEKQLVESQTYN